MALNLPTGIAIVGKKKCPRPETAKPSVDISEYPQTLTTNKGQEDIFFVIAA